MTDQQKKTKTYEGLFILNTAGKEENVREMIEKLEQGIQATGGKTIKVERMEKRPFARVARFPPFDRSSGSTRRSSAPCSSWPVRGPPPVKLRQP